MMNYNSHKLSSKGFYGKPWTTIQRKELFKRMKQLNLNVYMYGPKDCKKVRLNVRNFCLNAS